jgi:hypothetical protein
MKFDPKTHIIGKVYDLTQENMNDMLAHIERLTELLTHVTSGESWRHYANVAQENEKLRDSSVKLAVENDDLGRKLIIAVEALEYIAHNGDEFGTRGKSSLAKIKRGEK